MRSVDRITLPGLDPADPDLRGRRWHRRAGELLEAGRWLARSPDGVVVLDREAGEFFLRSPLAASPGPYLADQAGIRSGLLRELIGGDLSSLDGEQHRRLRGLVDPSLSTRASNRWRPAFRRILEGLWTELPGERFDIVPMLTRPYPALAIAAVLGVPAIDAPDLGRWAAAARQLSDPVALADPGEVAGLEADLARFRDWADPLIAARREQPGEDLPSSLIRTEEDGQRLTDPEVRSLLLNLLAGGIATVQAQLAHAVRLLAGTPGLWEDLRADPGLVSRTVTEVLRFEPATVFTVRRLVADLEYRELQFPEGTMVTVCSFTANRDPERFADPFTFDPLRDRERTRPATFGAGIHYCAGVGLARAELEEALAFLLERVGSIELTDEPELQPVAGIHATDHLEVRIHPPEAP